MAEQLGMMKVQWGEWHLSQLLQMLQEKRELEEGLTKGLSLIQMKIFWDRIREILDRKGQKLCGLPAKYVTPVLDQNGHSADIWRECTGKIWNKQKEVKSAMVGMKNTDVMSKNIKELFEGNLMLTYLSPQCNQGRAKLQVLIQRWSRENLFGS